jgi:hypothetical protein
MMLREVLLRMHIPALLEISVVPYRFASSVSERPVASKLARFQIQHASRVTSLRHRSVEIDNPTGRAMLPLLDGTRDIAALQPALSSPDAPVEVDDIQGGLTRLRELALLQA